MKSVKCSSVSMLIGSDVEQVKNQPIHLAFYYISQTFV